VDKEGGNAGQWVVIDGYAADPANASTQTGLELIRDQVAKYGVNVERVLVRR